MLSAFDFAREEPMHTPDTGGTADTAPQHPKTVATRTLPP